MCSLPFAPLKISILWLYNGTYAPKAHEVLHLTTPGGGVHIGLVQDVITPPLASCTFKLTKQLSYSGL